MDKNAAEQFAHEWIAAWNSHDLTQILSHYDDDFEMTSPLIVKLMGEPSGKLKGKKVIGDYWAKGLEKYPSLHFKLQHILCGAGSLTLIYDGISGISAEVLHFGPSGKVCRSYAHYLPDEK